MRGSRCWTPTGDHDRWNGWPEAGTIRRSVSKHHGALRIRTNIPGNFFIERIQYHEVIDNGRSRSSQGVLYRLPAAACRGETGCPAEIGGGNLFQGFRERGE